MLNSEDVLNLLRSKIGIGFSLIRYGDGEARVLNGLNEPDEYARILRRQLGDGTVFQDAIRIRENLIQTYERCDLVGWPYDKYRHGGGWEIAESVFYEQIEKFIPPDKKCHIDVHSHFNDKGLYHKLLEGVETVNYISCRSLNNEITKTFGVPIVNHYKIAPEIMFTPNYKGKKHYPDQFVKIESWMDKMTVEGSVCFVGAGVVGKIYCNWFRDRGGVAFDVGSIFDEWAGMITRGKERGANKQGNPNKL
jgi:hypothetical protein